MAESELARLQKELNFKQLQLNSLYELSSAIHSSGDVDHIVRIFFTILMGPLCIPKAFLFDRGRQLFRKKGFALSHSELQLIKKNLRKSCNSGTWLKVAELPADCSKLKELFTAKGIGYLVNISGSNRRLIVLGLGFKLNNAELSLEDLDFVFYLSQFSLVELDRVFFMQQALEKKRMESELAIARNIQRALMPQVIPRLNHYDIAVVYEPIREVGGDYYDILKKRQNLQPIVLADVEGKALSAALLAASSQAVFHSLNELYLFKPTKFIQKANSLIIDLTGGMRFITLFWMLLDDEKPALTYVNAGHVTPYLISEAAVTKLTTGGLLLGFAEDGDYQEETIPLKTGDMVVSFTDGVLEVENPDGEEFGDAGIVAFVRRNRDLPAQEIADRLYRRIKAFSQGRTFRDDFTIVLIKVK